MEQYKIDKYTITKEGCWYEISDGKKVVHSNQCLSEAQPLLLLLLWAFNEIECLKSIIEG